MATRRELPADVAAALDRVPEARERFAALPAERQAEWLNWIDRARGRRGRAARIDQAVRTLLPSEGATEEIAEPLGPPPERYWWLWLLLLLLLVIGGLLAWWLLTRGDDKSTVPNVIGLRSQVAAARIHDKDLQVTPVTGQSKRPANVVFAQAPGAGTQLDEGQTVTISISSGRLAVPDVTALPLQRAQQRLADAGFQSEVKRVASSRPKGIVVEQSPVAGVTAVRGTTVKLSVSSGVSTTTTTTTATTTTTTASTTTTTSTTATATVALSVRAPRVVGLFQTPALRRLNVLGLRPVVVYKRSSSVANRVLSQSPAAGMTMRRGSPVRVVVSSGPNPQPATTVPNVIGQDQATAADNLRAAGFRVVVLNRPTTDQSKDGLVIDEQPRAGSSIPEGSQVTLFVGRFTGG
jgi:beta-lactam-binding protein with PASTA domain